MPEVEVIIKIKLQDMPPKDYLKSYIRSALRAWGGQRHPNDWVFNNVKKVTFGKVKEV